MQAQSVEANTTPVRDVAAEHLPYLPGLDGIRALAVIAVLLYHADLGVPGGYLGVESFFVLSGFLITALLLLDRQNHGRVRLKVFWIRRARRLLPALFVALAGTLALAAILLPDEFAALTRDTLAAVGYVTNWYLIAGRQSYFTATDRPTLLQHLWSLAIEEQFYLVWPLIFAAGMRFLRIRGFLALTLVAALVSTLLMAALYDPGADPSRIYYGTDTRAAAILLGAALALVWAPGRMPAATRPKVKKGEFEGVAPQKKLLPHFHYLVRGPAAWISRSGLVFDLVGMLALGGLIIAYVLLNEQHPLLYRGGFSLVAISTAVVIAATTHPMARLLPWLLERQPLRWIGVRSYGIYLWHWPIFLVTRPGVDVHAEGWQIQLLRFVLTCGLAALSYTFVERPIRRGALGQVWRALRGARQTGRSFVAALNNRSYAVADQAPPSPTPIPHAGGSKLLPLSPPGRAGRGVRVKEHHVTPTNDASRRAATTLPAAPMPGFLGRLAQRLGMRTAPNPTTATEPAATTAGIWNRIVRRVQARTTPQSAAGAPAPAAGLFERLAQRVQMQTAPQSVTPAVPARPAAGIWSRIMQRVQARTTPQRVVPAAPTAPSAGFADRIVRRSRIWYRQWAPVLATGVLALGVLYVATSLAQTVIRDGRARAAPRTPLATRVSSEVAIVAPTQPTAVTPVPGATGVAMPAASPAGPSPSAMAQARIDPALATELQAILDRTVADGTIPGAVLTVQLPDGTSWTGASGIADREAGVAMTPDTRVRIGSLSKMFTAVVVLQLVEEGIITLDLPIDTWMPDAIPGGDAITVRQLLQHTSGLYDYLEDRRFAGQAHTEPERIWQPRELVEYATQFPPSFAPGARDSWDYSSTNYVILGMLVEQVTGHTLGQELQQRIFTPLGLRQTYVASEHTVEGPQAHGYSKSDDQTAVAFSFVFATANIVTTADDLGRFGSALFSNQLLDLTTREQIELFVNGKGRYDMPELEYGLGLMRNRLPVGPGPDGQPRPAEAGRVLGHIGGFGGFRAALWYAPENGTLVALSVNQASTDPNRLATEVLEAVLGWEGR